ncbi:VOC family protein [Humitalea sp. 24SJ18S-53]|uniref:VOC family protein n=1 Tax=Humitalea sp. 24SJ18S-53 TaxID=3422307 RepID=UPI003D677915
MIAPGILAYVSVGVADFDRAIRFYDAVLGALGHVRTGTWPETGWAGWSPAAEAPRAFYIARPFDGGAASVGNGGMVAFAVGEEALVRAAYDQGLAAGGTCEGPPGPRPQYGEGFYAAYLRDPDGNKIALVRRPD